MKPKLGGISIVDKTGTFLLWYDTRPAACLTCRERWNRLTPSKF
jgi:hypothetical protein